MAWYEIVTLLVGAFGGISGFISIYNAKSNKDTIDITNLSNMLDEARKERDIMKQEHAEMKKDMQEHLDSLKEELLNIEERERKHLASIYRAYRCPLYDRQDQCPVLTTFDENECETCSDKKCKQ